ncbi:hypothetical protein NDU88_002567 [Pleurodeles waltl]|uniref:Uncharacterized protein n=1 Tax=Pleurodeles waltl TaxID=8319 RepID=A0AAV7Q990_PLEWA|nr:hypothetical protein NDU88_002567 [Pleurodeles waltl]
MALLAGHQIIVRGPLACDVVTGCCASLTAPGPHSLLAAVHTLRWAGVNLPFLKCGHEDASKIATQEMTWNTTLERLWTLRKDLGWVLELGRD